MAQTINDDLGVKVGDVVQLSYFEVGPLRRFDDDPRFGLVATRFGSSSFCVFIAYYLNIH